MPVTHTQTGPHKRRSLAQLGRDERGYAVEYIMIAGCIAIACIFAFGAFGDQIRQLVLEQKASVGGITVNTNQGTATGDVYVMPKRPTTN